MRVVSQGPQQREVLGVAMEVVDAVTGRLARGGAGAVLELPPVVVDVAALHLMRGGGGAPQEAGGKIRAPLFGYARSLWRSTRAGGGFSENIVATPGEGARWT